MKLENTKKVVSVAAVSAGALAAFVGVMAGSSRLAVALGAKELSVVTDLIAPMCGCAAVLILAGFGFDLRNWWRGRA